MPHNNNASVYDQNLALGRIAGRTVGNKAGRNIDVDTGASEDVWSQGGIFVPPTVARIHAVVSDSANDTAAGSGMRTMTYTGLDANYLEFTETVTMNGLTPVNTVTPAVFIQRTAALTVGVGGTNAGNVRFTAATDGTVTHHMQAGYGQGANAIYLVPAGKTMLLSQYGGGLQGDGLQGGSTLDLTLITRAFGRGWQTRGNLPLNLAGQTSYKRVYPKYLTIPEKTFVKLQATVGANNTDVSAYFDYELVSTT